MNGIEVERDLRARFVQALAAKPARRSGSTTAEACVAPSSEATLWPRFFGIRESFV